MQPGIFLVILFVAVYGFCFWGVIRNIKARKWPTVEGRVVDAQAHEHAGIDEDIEYHVVINYCYDVNGYEYTGRHHALTFFEMDKAEKSAAGYIPDTPVEVFYRPGRPAKSLLEVRSNVGCSVFLLLFLLLPLILLGILYLSDPVVFSW